MLLSDHFIFWIPFTFPSDETTTSKVRSYVSKSPSSSGSHTALPVYVWSVGVVGTVVVLSSDELSVFVLLSFVLLFVLFVSTVVPVSFFANAFFNASLTAAMIPFELYVAPLTASTLSVSALCIAIILNGTSDHARSKYAASSFSFLTSLISTILLFLMRTLTVIFPLNPVPVPS